MHQRLSTSSIIIVASAMAISTATIFSAPTCARNAIEVSVQQTKRLQHAVDNIYKNPKMAEQELKSVSGPTAKAYLAFLYLSHKSTLPQPQAKIDALMRRAIAQCPYRNSLGDYDDRDFRSIKMQKLLIFLSLIAETDHPELTAPLRIFEEYPQECMSAFAPHYYSSQERAAPFVMNRSESFESIPAVAAFCSDIYRINGLENRETNGTMVYGSYKQQALERLQASLAPQLYYKEMNSAAGKRDYKDFTDFMVHWSLEELYNRRNYLAWQRDLEKAVAPLASHYGRRFHLSSGLARRYAETTLQGYSFAFLGRYSRGQLNEEIKTPIYKVFAPHADNVDVLKKNIGLCEISKSELAQALRLQILNDGSLEIVDWLLKLGAPVSGGIEPPLFTAVTRPDVIKTLLKAGADANEKNLIGKTALIQAAQYNALETIKELLKAGADINHAMTNSDQVNKTSLDATNYFSYATGGRTVLMYAAWFAAPSTIDYLLSKGADKTAKDSEGWTPAKFLSWNTTISRADKARLAKELQ